MLSDIEIAQAAKMQPITEIAANLGLQGEDVIPYGHYKAKLNHKLAKADKPEGKLILVTAISPTPAGEGKTTTSVGLADAMNALGKKTMLCLREPSLGPVFGIKGGAAGGGYAQVVPMEDINLHFTGDIHAIGAANNLLAAMIDNSIQQGNPLNIDPRRITWKRCMDMNDRQLRFIVDGLGGKVNGTPREDGFDITVASEVMAVFCLATDLEDLKARLSRIVCAYTYDGQPVTAGQIGAAGAMTALLKDALDPNLVQTLEHNPAIIHGGPFANIAHGCNSAIATRLSLKLADYVVTEAGFGADLGAEKFLDIKCRYAGLHPAAVVLVATVRALKSHGGVAKPDLGKPNAEAVRAGSVNLARHIENLQGFGLPVCVAINAFPTDTAEEMDVIYDVCSKAGVPCALSEVFAKGGEGGKALAETVLSILDDSAEVQYTYELDAPLTDKIEQLVRMAVAAAGLRVLAQWGAGYGCAAVLLGNTVSESVSCGIMLAFAARTPEFAPRPGAPLHPYTRKELYDILWPVEGSRLLASALQAAESSLIPYTLAIYTGSRAEAVAQYGSLKGMALPLLFFPFSVLGALSGLLMPEITRAHTKGDTAAMHRLIFTMLRMTGAFSLAAGVGFVLLGAPLAGFIYRDAKVGRYVQLLGFVAPFMYLESMVDGVLKGLGEQLATFRYSLFDSVFRIAAIWLVVPQYGMMGFLGVMAVSNLMTCGLNMRRMMKQIKKPSP